MEIERNNIPVSKDIVLYQQILQNKDSGRLIT
jgi:hypothetical protein